MINDLRIEKIVFTLYTKIEAFHMRLTIIKIKHARLQKFIARFM